MITKQEKKSILFLQKVIKEVNNYHKYNSPISDDVKQFALRINNVGGFYFTYDDAEEMIKYYKRKK